MPSRRFPTPPAHKGTGVYSHEQKGLKLAYAHYVRRVGKRDAISKSRWILSPEGLHEREELRHQYYLAHGYPKTGHYSLRSAQRHPQASSSSSQQQPDRGQSDPGPLESDRVSEPELQPRAHSSPIPSPDASLPVDLNVSGASLPDESAALVNSPAMAHHSAMDTTNVADSSSTQRGVPGSVNAEGGPPFPLSDDSARGQLHFSKSRVMFSYAYKTDNLQGEGAIKNLQIHITPLSFIPVDFLPFYLSPGEYQSLPIGSRVDRVDCTVKIVGIRSAFNTGCH
uniref:Uncharacterized protein n=1 Tax=Cacopsylla melanoneura TaxID=428564 RepID=A0A8D8TGC3_9HEMI